MHTPDPWELQVDGNDYVVVSNEQYTPIAVAKVYGTDENDDVGSRETNANLIIAAPALLCACEAVLAYEASPQSDPPDGATAQRYFETMKLVVEAVSKARGK